MMFIVVGIAQKPTSGVNVYVDVPTVDVLIMFGLHDPVIPPLLDDVGSNGAGKSLQILGIWLNVGIIEAASIVIFIVVGIAQKPVFGVNVYVDVPTVDVLIMFGLHDPVIAIGIFVDVVGNDGAD